MRKRERGSALFIAMLVVLVVASLSVVVVSDSVAKAKDAELEVEAVRSLYVAESAIDLAMDSVQTGGTGRLGTSAWGGGDDVGADGNGGTVDAGQGDGLPTVGEPDVALQNFAGVSGGQYYTYAMFWGNNGVDDDGDGSVDETDDEKYIWTLWAWGRFGNTIRRIKVIAEYHLVSIWDNAIIAGSGAAGAAINGNVKVHGGVMIFAEDAAGVPQSGPGIDFVAFSGGAGVRDSYDGLDPANVARMRTIGKGKNGLNTNVRLKHGRFKIQGAAALGENALGDPDDPATIENDEELIDGSFVTDGYSGSGGAASVHSENGTANPWDVPDSVKFPRLTDPFVDPVSGISFATYDAYATSRGLTVPAAFLKGINTDKPAGQTLNRIDDNTPDFSFGPDANGNFIKWDQSSQTLTVKGVVNIESSGAAGGDFHLGRNGGGDINYDDRGSLYINGASGDAHVHSNIIPKSRYLSANDDGSPGDVLGFVTKSDLFLADGSGDSQLIMYGIWRAGDMIKSQKQNEIYGVFISEFFDMGTNVPRIAHHPDVTKNLPAGFNAEPIPTTLFLDMWGEW